MCFYYNVYTYLLIKNIVRRIQIAFFLLFISYKRIICYLFFLIFGIITILDLLCANFNISENEGKFIPTFKA